MSSHLARRGGIWWARLVIPLRLRVLAGRREFSQSTRTHELPIAKLVASILVGSWRRQLSELECSPMTLDILKLIGPATALVGSKHLRLSDAVESTGIQQSELLRLAAEGRMPLFGRVPRVPGYLLTIEDLEFDNPAQGASGGFVLPLPRQMPDNAIAVVLGGLLAIPRNEGAALAGVILSEDLDAIDVLCFDAPNAPGKLFVPDRPLRLIVAALEVRADAVSIVHRHMRKNITAEQIKRAQDVQTASIKGVDISAGKSAHKLFSVALEAYAVATSGIPANVASLTEQKQKRRGCALFIELVGDMPLSGVSSDSLRQFREKLETIPAKANNIPKAYKRETLVATREALRNDGIEWPMMSEKARHERLQWVDQMFRWLVAQEWLNENPVASVLGEETKTAAERKTERQTKAQRKADGIEDDSDDREPFTPEELHLIFSQKQYNTGNGRHVRGTARWYPFEYWLPIIALHTGCRVKELSQLYLRDINRSDDGVWYFDINETTPDKSLKNENATRQIPVSPVLIELGLIAYRNRLEKEGFKRFFPELTYAKSDARYAKEPIRKMSAMFEGLGMPRDGSKVFHCLRANFNDALLRVPFSKLPFDDPDLKRFIRLKVIGHKLLGVNENHYSSTTMVEKLALVSGVCYNLAEIIKFDLDFGIEQVRVAINNKMGDRRGREDMGPLNKGVYGK